VKRYLQLGMFGFMGLMTGACPQANSEETSSLKGESVSINQVWNREDEIGRFEEAGDVDAYQTLFHEKFIGWPCDQAHPIRKAGVGEWLREVRDKHIKVTFALTHEGAEDFGNVVVVHYRVTGLYTYPDGHTEGNGEVFKLTHTWLRTGDTWQIIGGMCASLHDSPN